MAVRGRRLRPGGVARALFRLVIFVVLGFGVGLVFGLVTEEPDLLAGHLAGEGREVELEGDLAAPSAEGAAIDRAGSDSPTAKATPGAEATPEGIATPGAKTAPEGITTPGAAGEPSRISAARRVEGPQREPASRAQPTAVEPPAMARRPAAGGARPVAAILPAAEAARVAAGKPRAWAIQVGAFSDRRSAERLADGLRGRYPVEVLPAREQGGRWRVRVQPLEDEARARALAERLKQDERLPTWVTRMEARPGS